MIQPEAKGTLATVCDVEGVNYQKINLMSKSISRRT